MCECSDYDPPEFMRERNVKAKKTHCCCECLRSIWPGETYRNTDGKWDGRMETFKTCLDCLELAKRSGDECRCFGQLIDDLQWADTTPEIAEWLEARERRRLEGRVAVKEVVRE
jgi:hypothetical protein